MAWSNEEISQFQIDNNAALAAVNETLKPDEGLTGGKIGIMCFGQMGDLMTTTSVLKYRNEIFGNKQIIWFANFPNCEALKYAPISEVRWWPWPGNGLPVDSGGDYWPILMTEENRLNQQLKNNYKDTADLDDAYFPCPFMLPPQKRHGLDYPNCSRKVFGVPDDYEWHPVLNFSDQEKQAAYDFINQLPEGKKILFETFAGSSQSILSEAMITDAMNLCREKWAGCIFIFASHKYLRGNEAFPENFFNQQGVYSCAKFTVRQCALISDYCQLIISVSSGITVACSRWNSFKIPILQFCGSFICSTKSLASDRHFELVTADHKSIEDAKKEFEIRLDVLLNTYQ